MNNSTSTNSPDWPTRWPQASFKIAPTLALLAWIVSIALVVLVSGIAWLRFAYPTANAAAIPLIPALVVQLLLETGIVAVILAKLPSLSGFSLRELGFGPLSLRQVGVAVVGAVVMAVVANGSAALIESLTHSSHQQQVVEMFRGIHNPLMIGFFIVFAAVLAPVAEETIFRVFIFNFGLRYGGFWSGALLSGAVFGAAHGDMYLALPLALGGMVLCGVYYRTRNAFASMITHGLFNSLTLFALLVAPQLAKP